MAQHCIWCCTENGDSSIEHIIPEALGCPDGFVLTDGAVCRSCNNDLAHLDKAVIDEFDIFTYFAGVPTKRGKRPEIRSRGNVVGTSDDHERFIAINMGSRAVTGPHGEWIAAYGKSKRNVRAQTKTVDQLGEVSFTTSFGANPKFVRGILKIAFSALAYFIGPQQVTHLSYDSIRSYVSTGSGTRKVLVMPASDGTYANQAWLINAEGAESSAIELRLGPMDFFIDLTPTMCLFPILQKRAVEQFGESGWSYLPV
jgi:hypothetical protein